MKTAGKLLLSMIAIGGLLISLGCNNLSSPVGTGGDESASQIKGIAILKNGVEILEIKGTSIPAGLEISRAQNGDVYEVEFRDENEDVIDLSDDKYEINSLVVGAVASIEHGEHLDKFQFYIHGLYSGESTFYVMLNQSAQEKYKSPGVPITVK